MGGGHNKSNRRRDHFHGVTPRGPSSTLQAEEGKYSRGGDKTGARGGGGGGRRYLTYRLPKTLFPNQPPLRQPIVLVVVQRRPVPRPSDGEAPPEPSDDDTPEALVSVCCRYWIHRKQGFTKKGSRTREGSPRSLPSPLRRGVGSDYPPPSLAPRFFLEKFFDEQPQKEGGGNPDHPTRVKGGSHGTPAPFVPVKH